MTVTGNILLLTISIITGWKKKGGNYWCTGMKLYKVYYHNPKQPYFLKAMRWNMRLLQPAEAG
jgi:ATP sulfurylase